MPKLRELARIMRSKNAKPFVLTIDMLFPTPEAFHLVSTSADLTPEVVAKLYHIAPETVKIISYPPALAIKITMNRTAPAGSFDDRDLFGAQQAFPLFDLVIEPRVTAG